MDGRLQKDALMNTEDTFTTRIVHHIRSAAAFDPLPATPPRDMAAAYALQDGVAGALVNDGAYGAVAGWKIAANSKALLARFKLDEPCSGRVFSAQRRDSPAVLQAQDYRQFALEPEIAAVMGETLRPQDAPFDTARVMGAVARFIPSMELLDMRGCDMGAVHLPDAIAQNISNAGAVLGGPGIAADRLDPATVRTTLRVNGELRHDVTGAAPQHPLEAVTWLANHLAARGLTLEPGQVVLCGTHSPIWYHEGKGTFELEMSGLGTVMLQLE